MKLAIFTCFYSYHAYAPYIGSLAQTLTVLSKLKIEHQYFLQPSDFHIDRSLNTFLNDMMTMDFTDILLIDADETWNPETVVKMTLLPDEIVGASYRMKNRWNDYTGSILYKDGLPVGRMLDDGLPLLQATSLPGGFMRIKVSALRKMADAYPDLKADDGSGPMTQFFSRMVHNGVVYCQDAAFCKRWTDMGGTLWMDPTAKIGHWGLTCYDGDLEAKLRSIHSPPAEPAFEVIAQMAAEIEKRL